MHKVSFYAYPVSYGSPLLTAVLLVPMPFLIPYVTKGTSSTNAPCYALLHPATSPLCGIISRRLPERQVGPFTVRIKCTIFLCSLSWEVESRKFEFKSETSAPPSPRALG